MTTPALSVLDLVPVRDGQTTGEALAATLGLAFVLGWIGVKLIIHAMHEGGVVDFEIPTLLSLAVILVTLAVTALASLRKTRQLEDEAAA